ncbi:MAG TPA: hypothetical protein VGO73_02505 [Pyrinomonadaceae bacterium]|nr:hypothetical protein [Pyrinomonadaceae bacterium]
MSEPPAVAGGQKSQVHPLPQVVLTIHFICPLVIIRQGLFLVAL